MEGIHRPYHRHIYSWDMNHVPDAKEGMFVLDISTFKKNQIEQLMKKPVIEVIN